MGSVAPFLRGALRENERCEENGHPFPLTSHRSTNAEGKTIAMENENQPPAQQPPAQQPPAQQPPAQQDSLLSAINALPEKLLDAVREFTQTSPPQSPAQQQQQQQQQPPAQQPPAQQPPAQQPATQSPRRRSVADWYYGRNKS